MNIANFQEHVSSIIYDRGHQYFKNGYVDELLSEGHDRWSARIDGNYGEYSIVIKLAENGDIASFSCNCPFDGSVCKHVVAVLMAIKKKQKRAKPNSQKEAFVWERIVNEAPENELRNFLLAYAKGNRKFQDDLVVDLSAPAKDIDIVKYKKVVARIFKAAMGKHGYVEYGNMHKAISPVNNLLHKADKHIAKGNLHEAFSIAAAVATECIGVMEVIDDSNGECGTAIENAFNTVDNILHASPDTALDTIVFDWLLEQMQNTDYDNYGCDSELDEVFYKWANNPERLKKAYQFIESQLNRYQNETTWNSQFRLKECLGHKIDLLIMEGNQEEADRIINDNLHFSDFRNRRVAQAINREDYSTAIRLVKEGMELTNINNAPGIAHQFNNQLLDIYKKQNDTDNIRMLAREMFLNNRSTITYYRDYKATFDVAGWKAGLDMVIGELVKSKKKNNFGPIFPSELATVYIEEKMWDRLLAEVKQCGTIDIVDGYSKFLANTYPDELIRLYEKAIVKYAENTGRNVYITMAGYLKNMARLQGGKETAQKLAQQLLDIYKNRPAMKEEFKKIKW